MLNLEKSLEERGLGVKRSKIPGDAMIPHGPRPTRACTFGARLGICTCNCFCCFFYGEYSRLFSARTERAAEIEPTRFSALFKISFLASSSPRLLQNRARVFLMHLIV